ncbi:MAG TPA: hypothetical protein VMR75_01845, partial [Candidatus Saccharimonadales bacterium]|nr:hypothetical protein [Candidatus Saccharimonadales bacterium]
MARKKPVKSGAKNLPAKHYTDQEVRELLRTGVWTGIDPSDVTRKLGTMLAVRAEGEPFKEEEGRVRELIQAGLAVTSLDTHFLLAIATSDENYQPYSIELANQLIKEYDCTTASEITLVHLIVSSYIRSLEYARNLSLNSGGGKSITAERNGLYAVLSKEIDRANRQFVTGLTTLKQLKAPPLTVNVKTDTAF